MYCTILKGGVCHSMYSLLGDPGVKLGEACTIVLRGATQQILDEADRSLHDALCVLSQTVEETATVFGGGELLLTEVFNVFEGSLVVWRILHKIFTLDITEAVFENLVRNLCLHTAL